jgi:hypothetical protein
MRRYVFEDNYELGSYLAEASFSIILEVAKSKTLLGDH